MKKNFITIGMALISALFITTNCAKEEVSPINEETRSEAVSFKLNVSAQETRTTTEDGATVNWASGDAINVFHAVTGTTEYGSNDKFTLAEGTTFNGALADGALDESKTYDWYVMYPYASQIVTPKEPTKGYLPIGSSKSSVAQKQTGNNNKKHLAGQYFPLYGKAVGVDATATPSITLKQALAVVKIHVTNNNDEELTVSNVSFTGTEDIVGTYYIDFTGDTPVFTASGASYVSNVANLTVSNGTGVAKNSSADFYIAVKPFTANGTLKVAVNGYEKEYPVTNKTFSAGKIKTINFSYDRISTAKLNFEISGEGGFAAYSSVAGMSSSGIESDYASSNSPYLAKFDNTGDYVQVRFNEAAGKATIGVKMLGGATTSYFNVMGSVDGTAFTLIQKLTVAGAQNATLTLSTTEDISETYRYIRFIFEKGDNVAVGPISISKPSTDPEIIAENIANIPATGVIDATTTYSLKNFTGEDDITVVPDGTIVTHATVDHDTKTITYDVNPNYDYKAKSGTITLRSDSEGITKEITVFQLKSDLKVNDDTKNITITIPYNSKSATFTVTSAEFDWEAIAYWSDDNIEFYVSPENGEANVDAQTLTVTSEVEPSTAEQTLGWIEVFRNDSTDPQLRKVTIKKAATPSGDTYTKVTSISEGTYLICYTDGGKVITGPGSTMPTADVIISESGVIAGSSSIEGYEFTVTALTGSDAGYYSFKNGTTFIGYNSSTNFTSGSSVANDNYKWKIEIDSETGLATITCKGASTRYWGWNNSSGFKAYSTSNMATYPRPTLYKKD